jgi:hypothetical protein
MTWGEFKKAVEEGGVTDEMEIWFIDVSFPYEICAQPQEEGTPNEIGITVT